MLATQSLNPHPYPPVPYSSASTVAAYASSGPLAAMSMYNSMQQQHHHHHHPQQSPYAFAAQPAQQQAPPPPRQYGTQGTSSAFSASANPDEDWTKISDLAERRRIQNRIAQRNYRKKLKRRLEDLERRAGSPDSTESQKPSPAKPAKRAPAASKVNKIQKQQPKQRQLSTSPVLSPPSAPAPSKQAPPHMQFTPPTETVDEFIMPSQYDDARDPSHSPPPMYAAASSAYSSYPPPDEHLLLTPYSTAQAYPTMVTADGGYTTYLPTASAAPSTTIPPMTHFTDAFKRDSYASDSGISSYSAGYSFYPGMDVNGSSPYESNPHTPPLSHTFDHSANCSESGYDYPTTPLSMPGSPAMVQSL